MDDHSPIDWYTHYKNKLRVTDFEPKDLDIFYTQDKELVDYILSLNPKKIVEVGSGLARTSFVLASKGLEVTCLDIEKRFIELGEKNAERLGVSLKFIHGDLKKISDIITPDTYDLSFNSGFFEHFSDMEIRYMISKVLEVTPRLVFTVPISSEENNCYFDDEVYRRLLEPEKWLYILKGFKIKKFQNITSRHNDLLIEIER